MASVYDGPLNLEFVGPDGSGYGNVTRDFRDEFIDLLARAVAAGVTVTNKQTKKPAKTH